MLKRKTHGSWCTLRSFETHCQKCNKKVLYWECRHGCKVFFDLPASRPMTKHICNRKSYKEFRREQEEKFRVEYVFREDYNCPVCQKFFSSEKALKNHLKNLRHQDDEHSMYYANEKLGTNQK